jgi:hypothetical protein
VDRGLHRDCSPASFAKSREERKIEVHNPRKNAGRGRVKTHMSSRVSHDGVAALVLEKRNSDDGGNERQRLFSDLQRQGKIGSVCGGSGVRSGFRRFLHATEPLRPVDVTKIDKHSP